MPKEETNCLPYYKWLTSTGSIENSDLENPDHIPKKTQTLPCLETSDPYQYSRIQKSNTLSRYGELNTVQMSRDDRKVSI